MRRTSTILLNIGPSIIEVGSSDDVSTIKHIDVELPSDPELWAAELVDLAPAIKCCAEELKLSKAKDVIIAYRNPTIACHFTSLPGKNINDAVKASRLSCVGSTNYDHNNAVTSGYCIGKDNNGLTPKLHTVVGVDRVDSAEAVVKLVSSCGWSVKAMFPMEAITIADIVNELLNNKSPDTIAKLHFGSYKSIFVVGQGGRLRLFRQIDMGISHLVDSITKDIHINDTGKDVALTKIQAREWLLRNGIPSHKDVIDEKLGVKGYHIMPLLQPVLQRFLIELKQSLRFGITDVDSSEILCSFIGPGTQIRGLINIISEGIEIDPSELENTDQAKSNVSVINYEIKKLHELCSHTPIINLIPRSALVQQIIKLVQRGLWYGAAAAVLLIAVDMYRLDHVYNQSVINLEKAQQQREMSNNVISRRENIIQVNKSLLNLENNIAVVADYSANWSAILTEIVKQMPDGLQLMLIDGSAQDAQDEISGRLSVHGYAIGNNARDLIQEYINRLKDSALVSQVKLGSVQRAYLDDQQAQRFNFEVDLASVDNKYYNELVAATQGADNEN